MGSGSAESCLHFLSFCLNRQVFFILPVLARFQGILNIGMQKTEYDNSRKRVFTGSKMKSTKLVGTIRERYGSLPEITAKVFLVSMISFFLSSLMSTMGGIVDGFIVAIRWKPRMSVRSV